MNPLLQLRQEGQSVWLDDIRRSLIESGELERMIEEDGLRGLTSNPKIFMVAITRGDEYEAQINELHTKKPRLDAGKVYETIAIDDIRAAADVLRRVYDDSDADDGFVSLEVSPHLAHDTSASIDEARRLWKAVDRPNLMVKIPATPESIPAIETCLSEGININITLMFSMAHYEAVAQAYLRALDQAKDPTRIRSVASFFVSRIDTAVDKALDALDSDEARSLKGKIAIANAKMTYQRFRDIFHGDPFKKWKEKGAHVQRVLWGSTSTKNPDYSDVMYVESLIGPETINTMPPKTVDAFRDHGRVQGPTLTHNIEEAREQLQKLADLGLNLDEITEQVQSEGVTKFCKPLDELLEVLETKRREHDRTHAGETAAPAARGGSPQGKRR